MEEVEKATLNLLDSLYKEAITVHDFQSTSVLHTRVNETIRDMQNLEKCRDSVKDVQIPSQLINYLQDGKNPDSFSRELFQTLVDKNQKTAGRVKSLEMFKKDLDKQVKLNFPEFAPESSLESGMIIEKT